MHKGFHEQFNPAFSEQFSRIFRDKIDWAPTGGLGNYPSIGLKKLIEEIGITTNLSYDADHYAVNFENLSKEFRNSIPDRPFYVMEEKKCHDVIEALISINREKIENSRKEMELKYDESYRGNGPIRQPVLSLMMWGPLTYFDIKKTDSECKYDTLIDRQAGAHVCSNFAEKHFWMYTHSERVECIRGSIDNLAGPVMTPDLKIIYHVTGEDVITTAYVICAQTVTCALQVITKSTCRSYSQNAVLNKIFNVKSTKLAIHKILVTKKIFWWRKTCFIIT